MKNLSLNWRKAIIWFTAYVNVIAFFLAGGYIYLNTSESETRLTFKNALALSIGFTCLGVLQDLLYYLLSIFKVNYQVLNTLNTVDQVIFALKIIVFAVFVILDFCGKKPMIFKEKDETAADANGEGSSSEN